MKRSALKKEEETGIAKLPSGWQVTLFAVSLLGTIVLFFLTMRHNLTRPQGDPGQDIFAAITRRVYEFNSQ